MATNYLFIYLLIIIKLFFLFFDFFFLIFFFWGVKGWVGKGQRLTFSLFHFLSYIYIYIYVGNVGWKNLFIFWFEFIHSLIQDSFEVYLTLYLVNQRGGLTLDMYVHVHRMNGCCLWRERKKKEEKKGPVITICLKIEGE